MAPRTESGPVQVVLLAGPSGSGKSRVARVTGQPQVMLDHFYYDADHPDLPHTRGIVDWDDPASWDGRAALRTVVELAERGAAALPDYDIATSRRTGWNEVELRGSRCVIAEGIFAPELVGPARDAGLAVIPLYLDRPRTLTALLRFARDVREHRKPVGVLLRRGIALWRAEPTIRQRALAAGCRPVSLRTAVAIVSGIAEEAARLGR